MVENLIQIKSGIMINGDVDQHVCKKGYIWNPATCSCENGKVLVSIIYNSVIMCDKIIKETKTVQTNFNKKFYLSNKKCVYFTNLFINYHYIIDSF